MNRAGKGKAPRANPLGHRATRGIGADRHDDERCPCALLQQPFPIPGDLVAEQHPPRLSGVIVEDGGDPGAPLAFDNIQHHLGMAAGAEYHDVLEFTHKPLPRNLSIVAWPGWFTPAPENTLARVSQRIFRSRP